MTAEIAILNANGIALAADSAASCGEQKIYNSVNKLFALSKHHPVAVMIYNASNHLTIPWEILIKQCRNELGRRKFERLQEYVAFFWAYIDKVAPHFSAEIQREHTSSAIYDLLNILKNEITRCLSAELTESEQILAKSKDLLESLTGTAAMARRGPNWAKTDILIIGDWGL